MSLSLRGIYCVSTGLLEMTVGVNNLPHTALQIAVCVFYLTLRHQNLTFKFQHTLYVKCE
jgi:hypothetical protein